MNNYDAIIIGAGISGLTAASLLSKRGLKVAVIDKTYTPGGSCGVFKRKNVTFDRGSAMLYGFGENGFNSHRFVFNCLNEPIEMIKHDNLYCVNYNGKRVMFPPDVEKFADELCQVFPTQKENIHRFYGDMLKMYNDVMVETPSYSSADETSPKTALKSVMRHPISYIKFLSYLNKSAESLLKKYFKDPRIFNFFNKMTSTYCYTTVKESPAVLAAVMFVDNHVGGSYYPAGSTLILPGKLEKVIEQNGGDMIYNNEVTNIIIDAGKAVGVKLSDDRELKAKYIIYSGTVWNLYDKLISQSDSTNKRKKWAKNQQPTYSSVVLYTVVDKDVIPADTQPVEMLAGNPEALDESEVTVYILSIDDRTLCAEDEHTVIAIGPSFTDWDVADDESYRMKKQSEEERLIAILEKRFPGFRSGIRYRESATPKTIERYTMKNKGAVAGPKQALGQHMFLRLHTRTEWQNLFCCGESTVMGTGTPTVTTSGISAANAILKSESKEPFIYKKGMENYVKIVEKPVTKENLYHSYEESEREIMLKARRCRMCEHPSCSKGINTDIRGINRRVMAGNFFGAKKCFDNSPCSIQQLKECEKNCIENKETGSPVEITEIVSYVLNKSKVKKI